VTVAAVGGGIAGLAAAYELVTAGIDVVVLEASDRLGGKIQTEDFAGVAVETAPDSFLARRPEAVALCRALGLGDELVRPSETSAYLYGRGELRRLPAGQVLGVPTNFRALSASGIVTRSAAWRAALEPWLPGRPLQHDEAVGSVIARRYGRQVAERLVDPLVGGINAGNIDELSIDVAAAQLAAAARKGRSLTATLRATPPPTDPDAPVFLTVSGGLSRLVDALVTAIRDKGGEVRTGATVDQLARDGKGYRVGGVEAEGIVLAVPAGAAATLIGDHAPGASTTLAAVRYASVALATMAFPEGAVDRPLDASGYLVPRPSGLTMTACTWADRKWAHLRRPGQVLLRASAGRVDNRDADLDDDALVARLRSDLATTMGLRGEPSAVRVHRWPSSFPQYAPGHLDRMAAAHRELAERLPGVGLAGAALSGVGIPACIGSGQAAARIASGRDTAPS